MDIKYLTIIIVLIFVINTGNAQVQTGDTLYCENRNYSGIKFSGIDSILTQSVDSLWINNCIAFISQRGKILYYNSYGKTEEGNKIPLDAIYRIASQTKAITCVAALKLYEQGRFSLDDPVSKYIPEFKNMNVIKEYDKKEGTYTVVPANREITIKDLFTHTSGIEYPEIGQYASLYAKSDIPAGWTNKPLILGDKVKELSKYPLIHQPCTQFMYSYSIDVIGYLIEILSGKSLKEYLEQNIFTPLGMHDTYFYLPQNKYSRLIQMYTENAAHKLIKWDSAMPGLQMDFALHKGTYYAGGAGLVSTIKDYAIFLQMLLNGGEYNGHRILSKSTVKLLTTNQIGNIPADYLGPNRWSLGFMIITKEGQPQFGMSEGSFVWGGAFNTVYWVDPQKEIVALLYINQSPLSHHEIIDNFKKMVNIYLPN